MGNEILGSWMKRKKQNYDHGRERDWRNEGKGTRYGVKKNTKKCSEKRQKRKPADRPENTSGKKRGSDSGSGTGSLRHIRDVNSREIFKNGKLVCQFLRDYTDIPIFADIRPEDIEDVTARYRTYLGVEFEADTVKKVKVRVGEEQWEVYVIPLIEHKSYVDYDVQMQLLRYMSVIWYDYGKRQDKLARQSGRDGKRGRYRKSEKVGKLSAEGKPRQPVTARKSFRYPLIIPIVYYEGAENWTADMELWKRIELGEEMRAYIPDFSYKVVRLHDYSSEEIQEHGNEMSLVFLFNRIQSPEDYSEFIKSSKEYMAKVLADTAPELVDVLLEVFWALLMKMNVPQEEAEELVENLGGKDMGFLFANAEKMDIQAERRNTKEAREWAEKAERKLKSAEAQLESAEARAETEKEKALAAEERAANLADVLRSVLSGLVGLCREAGYTKEETKKRLHDYYQVDESDLDEYFEAAWQGN